MVKLLVIDDELPICDILKDFFSKKDYQVFIATTVEEGLSIVRKENPHVILLDIIMPGRSGIEALKQIKEIDDKAKVIMLTGISNEKVIKQTMEHGASDYITKPFSLEYLEKEVIPKILKQLI
jgi:DNA-binding response OmpR family regulator